MLFTPPSITDILDDTRLRPEQVSALLKSAEVLADVDGRLPTELAQVTVEARNMLGGVTFPFTPEWLAPRLPDENAAVTNEEIQTLLTDAVKKLATWDLLDTLPGSYRVDPDKIEAAEKRYLRVMATLATRIGFIVGREVSGGGGGEVEAGLAPVSLSVSQVLAWV